jgi:hypothetical protein
MLPDGIHILIISASVLWDDEQDDFSESTCKRLNCMLDVSIDNSNNYFSMKCLDSSSIDTNLESDSNITLNSFNNNKSSTIPIYYRSSLWNAKTSENTKDYSRK